MGTDKALLSWGDGTLLDHMAHTLESVANPVLVVGRAELPDRNPGRGPIEGIATALDATATDQNIIVAVDLPYLDTAFLGYLAACLGSSSTGLVICTIDQRTPLCLGIHRQLLAPVERYLESGARSLKGFLGSVSHDTIHEEALVKSGFSAEMFRNLNTPADYPG
jgi:molybdopterin-guanine dinucleotide biosynthesis protein A